MNPIGSVKSGATQGAGPAHSAARGNAVADVGSLLPQPVPADEREAMNMSLQAILLMSQQADTELSSEKATKVNRENAERKEHLQKMIQDMREEAAQNNSPGFFKSLVKVVKDFASDVFTHPADIVRDLKANISTAIDSPNFWADLKKIAVKVTEVAALVASVAAAVATAGAGSVLIAGVLIGISALSFAQSEFQILQELKLDPKIAAAIQLGLAVASIVLSMGADAAKTTEVVRTIKQGAAVVQLAGTTADGTATIAGGYFEKEQLERKARIKAHQNAMDNITDLIKSMIEDIKEHKENSERFSKNVTGALDAKIQTMNVISAVRA